MRNLCDIRLDKSFRTAPVLALTPHSRIVLVSDCHRGVGNSNDNFLKINICILPHCNLIINWDLLILNWVMAMNYGRTAVITAIREIHGNVFWLLSLFASEGRLYQLYGNHDHVLKGSSEMPHLEGLILKVCDFGTQAPCLEFYMTHGHRQICLILRYGDSHVSLFVTSGSRWNKWVSLILPVLPGIISGAVKVRNVSHIGQPS